MNDSALILIGLAAVAGGAVNALAGGGTLITFPMLTAVGVPAVTANITNTIALCPGYLGATYAQRSDLRGQLLRLCALLPIGLAGGLAGGVLLLHSGEQLFRSLVPFLILFAVALLALQDSMRTWILGRTGWVQSSLVLRGLKVLPVAPAAVYGGYFGAGASVIILAVLGLVMDDTLKRLNALKQAIALSMNIAAAIFLVFSRQVVWPAVLVMAAGAVAGGVIGGRLANRVPAVMLRRIIVTIGVIVALIYLVNQ
ncbi:MAG: sulfite exporter TauE/SafE family protein [Geobacteraceae bacterium]|nr:sulfite exporter TauE/SafE family protein [Geobacteraceae bacterium]